MFKLRYFFTFIFCSFSASAQETLTLQQAIDLGLKNAYSISIANSQREIASNNFQLGRAAFLPSFDINASGSLSNYNTQQSYANGLEINRNSVKSNNINASAGLNWTIFDGMKMFASYSKLKELQEMGEISAKIAVENSIAHIMIAYFSIVKEQEVLETIKRMIVTYEERVKITERKFNIGSGTKPDVLLARIDLNTQRSNLLRQQAVVAKAIVDLNVLIGLGVDKEYYASDSIAVSASPVYENLKNSALNESKSLLFAEKNVEISNLTLKEVRSERLPTISLNANYNFTRTENQAGFLLSNQNRGINTGFTASWNLFNGFNTRSLIKNAEITTLISQIEYNSLKTETEGMVSKTYKDFSQAVQILSLEKENLQMAEENSMIAMELFKAGSFTTIELRLAQDVYERAQVRLAEALLQAKVAEIELLRITGQLIK